MKIQIQRLGVLALLSLGLASLPQSAKAFAPMGMNPGMAFMMSQPATGQMGPFNPAMTGMEGGLMFPQQQTMMNPFNAYANLMQALSWQGVQPLGLGSYLPPMGMSAINNSMIASQISPWDFMGMPGMGMSGMGMSGMGMSGMGMPGAGGFGGGAFGAY